MFEFTFADYHKLTRPTKLEIKDWKENYSNSGGVGLRVVMEATHSGIINDNSRFYIPSLMEKGVSTFKTENKPTKILKHHDSSSDPVGIVREAVFVPTIPDNLINNPDVMTLMSSTSTIKDQLKSFRNLFLSGAMSDENWRGLGYIQIVGDILDPESIEQIKDGRFDAVSTSFRPSNGVYCSACDQNLIEELCDHINPFSGKTQLVSLDEDDENSPKVPAVPIPGNHNYSEVSLVTMEGDKFATIKILDDKNKDNNTTIFLPDSWKEDDNLANNSKTSFEFKDFREDTLVMNPRVKKVFEIIKNLRADMDEDSAVKLAEDIASEMTDDNTLPDQQEAEIDFKTAVKHAVEYHETKDKEIDVDGVYALYEEELEALGFSDKKLSTKQRNSLPKSVFCGPERSFPVPDCAHVTAARRLIGRYKGPGNKSNILACVSRKAKALGCSGDDNLENEAPPVVTEDNDCLETSISKMSNDELKKLFYAIEVMLIDRDQKISYECSDCALNKQKVKEAEEKEAKAKDSVKNIENQLSILREELRFSYSEFQEQVNKYIQQGTELHAEKTKRLSLMSVLSGKSKTLEEAADSLSKEEFSKQESIITDSFNLEKITEKLNDGMSNVPKGTVDSPVKTINKDNLQLPEGLSQTCINGINAIKDLLKDNENEQAKFIYDKMKTLEVIPKEITFESISAELNEPAE